MKYFYIHPFKPQYFFPKGFKKHQLFLNFFTPYTLSGKISWFLFYKISLYRIFFYTRDLENIIPESKIRSFVGKDPLMAFNTGTIGQEQKITALGIDNFNNFFIKYGQTEIARKNVTNEHFVLKQLSNLDFVPKVIDFYTDNTQVLLKTNVLKGERLKYGPIDKNILDKLIILSRQKIDCSKITSGNLVTSFSHGDFCPWNIISENGNISVFDWEMAGIYSLGYDLFTYIFQSCFILNTETAINKILIKNIDAIEYYFSHFNLDNWKPYLISFAQYKLSVESLKGDYDMLNKYSKLLEYAKKT